MIGLVNTLNWTVVAGMVLSSASQAAPVTKVTFLQGEVRVGKEGAGEPVKMDQVVSIGDTVRTGPKSLAIVTLHDGSLLKLKADTELTIGKTKGAPDLTLRAGGVFAEVKPQRKGSPFVIRTKAVVMGVRGTRFFAAYEKVAEKEGQLWMCVNEGVVAVETNGKDPVPVSAGMGISVPDGKDVTPPKAYGWTKKLNWNMDPAQGEVEDKSSARSRYEDLIDQNYD